jgi:hypothetical protein
VLIWPCVYSAVCQDAVIGKMAGLVRGAWSFHAQAFGLIDKRKDGSTLILALSSLRNVLRSGEAESRMEGRSRRKR